MIADKSYYGYSDPKPRYRCIYCGKAIPPDTGLSCPSCSAANGTFKNYDKEFAYADEIEPQVAKIMEETEVRSVAKSSNQTREEFMRLYELNLNSRKDFRWPNQEELQKKREGRILHMNKFLEMFRKALPAGYSAWFTNKGGMANTLGLFVNHPIGAAPLPTCTHDPGTAHYVGFVQVPFMQEFEELHFDRYNVPLGSKRRGWRTVLLRAREQQLVSEGAIYREFGSPPTGPVSDRYRAYEQYLRGIGK